MDRNTAQKANRKWEGSEKENILYGVYMSNWWRTREGARQEWNSISTHRKRDWDHFYTGNGACSDNNNKLYTHVYTFIVCCCCLFVYLHLASSLDRTSVDDEPGRYSVYTIYLGRIHQIRTTGCGMSWFSLLLHSLFSRDRYQTATHMNGTDGSRNNNNNNQKEMKKKKGKRAEKMEYNTEWERTDVISFSMRATRFKNVTLP